MSYLVEQELLKTIRLWSVSGGMLPVGEYTIKVHAAPNPNWTNPTGTWDLTGVDINDPSTWVGASNIASDNRVLFAAWLTANAGVVNVIEANAHPPSGLEPAYDTYRFETTAETAWPEPLATRLGTPTPYGAGGSGAPGGGPGGAGPIVDPADDTPGWCDAGGRLESVCGPDAPEWLPWALGGGVVLAGGLLVWRLAK